MRTTQLVTSYIQALVFVALGARSVQSWLKDRDRRSGHLAIAAGLFGLNSAMSAVTNTFIDTAKLEVVPRWEQILSGVIIYLSIYAFLLFLSDFVNFHPVIHVLIVLVTITSIVFAFIERPDLRFDPQKGIVTIPGVHNPVSYRAYIGWVLIYLAIAFGVLAFAFLVYGLRSKGLARFRMLFIGAGFFLLFVVIGLLPRLIFGDPSAKTIRDFSNILQYVALVSAPLLFVGFSPPKSVRDMYARQEALPAPGAAAR